MGSRTVHAFAVAATLATLAAERTAHACQNAVQLAHDERIQLLQDAEAALDEGDLDRASDLAWRSRIKRAHLPVPGDGGETPEKDRLDLRADRVTVLAWVRDPRITYTQSTVPDALVARRAASPGPGADAEYAEALAHVPGRHDEAFAILEPLARKDLLGSPHALGALHRLAEERRDERTARDAQARCEGMIGTSPTCRDGYARPPLIRGTTRSYLPPMLLALAALAYRLVRSRRAARGGTVAGGRLRLAPWIGHAAPLQALALFGGALYVFARATSPNWTAFVFACVVALSFAIERRSFFAAVRRDLVPGLTLRRAAASDGHLPSLALYRGPEAPHTLEHEHAGDAQPGYREAPRTPLLRLERRRLPIPVAFALACVVALVMLLLLFAALALLQRAL